MRQPDSDPHCMLKLLSLPGVHGWLGEPAAHCPHCHGQILQVCDPDSPGPLPASFLMHAEGWILWWVPDLNFCPVDMHSAGEFCLSDSLALSVVTHVAWQDHTTTSWPQSQECSICRPGGLWGVPFQWVSGVCKHSLLDACQGCCSLQYQKAMLLGRPAFQT